MYKTKSGYYQAKIQLLKSHAEFLEQEKFTTGKSYNQLVREAVAEYYNLHLPNTKTAFPYSES